MGGSRAEGQRTASAPAATLAQSLAPVTRQHAQPQSHPHPGHPQQQQQQQHQQHHYAQPPTAPHSQSVVAPQAVPPTQPSTTAKPRLQSTTLTRKEQVKA